MRKVRDILPGQCIKNVVINGIDKPEYVFNALCLDRSRQVPIWGYPMGEPEPITAVITFDYHCCEFTAILEPDSSKYSLRFTEALWGFLADKAGLYVNWLFSDKLKDQKILEQARLNYTLGTFLEGSLEYNLAYWKVVDSGYALPADDLDVENESQMLQVTVMAKLIADGYDLGKFDIFPEYIDEISFSFDEDEDDDEYEDDEDLDEYYACILNPSCNDEDVNLLYGYIVGHSLEFLKYYDHEDLDYYIKMEYSGAHIDALVATNLISCERDTYDFCHHGALNTVHRIIESYQYRYDLKYDYTISDMENAFKKLYRGRAPKLLEVIYCVAIMNNYSIQDVMDKFNFRVLQKILSNGINEYLAVYAMLKLGVAAASISDSEIIYLLRNVEDEYLQWYGKNCCTNKENLFCIVDGLKDCKLNGQKIMSLSIRQVLQLVRDSKASSEAIKIRDKYHINVSDCICNLDTVTVQYGAFEARILEGNELVQTTIGYDTNCCQHFEGAGETAMMYGLLNPDAGFLAVSKTGVVKAQAEIWLSKEGVLVLDNIEFANDGRINSIKPVLVKWLEAVSYNNVVMGLGYNALKFPDMERVEEKITQPLENIPFSVYTDISQGIVWLKKNGKIML